MDREIQEPQHIQTFREILDWAIFSIGALSLGTAIVATVITHA